VVGTDRTLAIKEVARAAFQPGRLPRGLEPGLYETGTFSPSQDTYPNGCHVVEVEIDPDTGACEIVSYKLVDDVGTVINPLTLYGQLDRPTMFHNPTRKPARYAVVIACETPSRR
jgi:carbon-monoxide dehydrogenase large subunit